MANRFIPVAEPVLEGNEKKYVLECLERGWISGSGKYVDAFEEQFAAFCDVPYAIAVANGTVALHVALMALGIGRGDEVIVPDLTYIASANAVSYCGAKPILADIDPVTWTLDPQDAARKISSATKAIMPVHLYGHPVDMDPILQLAKAHELYIVEDAAEAHGAEYKGRLVGGLGDIAAFSFFGNKIITAGEGGILTTNDRRLAKKIRLLKGQGVDPQRRYWFPIIGYNYRLTNLQAAVAVAQFERIDWFIERRREVARWYEEALRPLPVTLPSEAAWAKTVCWLYSICLPEEIERDVLIEQLMERGIETRPFFYPMHQMPPYYEPDGDLMFPVSTSRAMRGLSLPTSAKLSRDEVAYIALMIHLCLEEQSGSERSTERNESRGV
ncbi:MAG: DegT/DnrJ/EryC1/StrS family aminotransferase [Pyrinomonadaceae bacterium]